MLTEHDELTGALRELYPDTVKEVDQALFEAALLEALVGSERRTLGTYRAIRQGLSKGKVAEELSSTRAIPPGSADAGLGRLSHPAQEDAHTSPLSDRVLSKEIPEMITSQASVAALTDTEILEWLDEIGIVQAADEADQKAAKNTYPSLERVRLLHRSEQDDVDLYMLANDHPTTEVATWISTEEMAVKLTREILRRAVINWHGTGVLIQTKDLALIHGRREELKQLDQDELDLLFRSALGMRYEVNYWVNRARAGGVRVNEFLLAGLHNDDFNIRVATLDALGQLGEQQFVEPSIKRLEDDYPQVRIAAIRALERLQPDGRWREQLVHECYVPAGPFIMGDDNGRDDEKPAHRVNLNAFYINKCPVTNAEYKRYMDAIGRPFRIPEGRKSHPVVSVSWHDACDYAAWAGMRLPTEAEWEKAASWSKEAGKRGDEGLLQRLVNHLLGLKRKLMRRKRRYPWGNEFDVNKCNVRESHNYTTTPVGKYSPEGDSPYGCADMAGNVREWVSDWYSAYPSKEQTNPTGPETGTAKVLRGGSFCHNWYFVRAANRTSSTPYLRYYSLGFRCVFVGSGE